MAAKISKLNQELGLSEEMFELTIKKPLDNSDLIQTERKVGKTILHGTSRKNEVSADYSKRLKKTINMFLSSSYDTLIIVGKMIKKSE